MKVRKKKKYNLHSRIMGAVRKVWRYSPHRRAALEASKIGTDSYLCTECARIFGRKEISVDHTEPVIDPDIGFYSYDAAFVQMFDGPQATLCKECHGRKTRSENARRKLTRQKRNVSK